MNEKDKDTIANIVTKITDNFANVLKTEVEQLNVITEQLKEINNNLKDSNDDLLWIVNFIKGGGLR